MKQIILASTSPRRKELLEQLGLKFRVVAPNTDEKLNPRLKPRSNAEQLSIEKVKAVALQHTNAVIIAADTFLVARDEIIGKSKDERGARRILQKLSGDSHTVVTGFTIFDSENGKSVTKSVETKVFFKKLSKKDIDWYMGTGEPVGIPGYKIQKKGCVLVEKIEGDYTNVIGLPLPALFEELKRFDIGLR